MYTYKIEGPLNAGCLPLMLLRCNCPSHMHSWKNGREDKDSDDDDDFPLYYFI